MARALGLAGAQVTLLARRADLLETAAANLRQDGIEVDWLTADLLDAASVQAAGNEALKRHQCIDIVVNAAGMNRREAFMDVCAAAFDEHTAIHLRAPFLLVQSLAPAMQAQRWGRILNLASLQSSRAFPNSAPYGAGKGGIVQLTRAMAQHWSPHGITANAIGPGFFPTPLTAPVFNDTIKAAANAAQTCIGRNGELTDLYGATVFLASDASAYITGQTLMVDGGFTAK
jgi:NAD(P)-dependent dehydrogenase (short-subunit alcohol dehydrogenase family)